MGQRKKSTPADGVGMELTALSYRVTSPNAQRVTQEAGRAAYLSLRPVAQSAPDGAHH